MPDFKLPDSLTRLISSANTPVSDPLYSKPKETSDLCEKCAHKVKEWNI